jgi:chitinase
MRLPFHIISHAPQAPYFSPSFSPKGAYRTLKTVFSNIVDFYNLQYYNQGNTTYETYSSLFLDSGPLNPDSAVFQLIGQGLRP